MHITLYIILVHTALIGFDRDKIMFEFKLLYNEASITYRKVAKKLDTKTGILTSCFVLI